MFMLTNQAQLLTYLFYLNFFRWFIINLQFKILNLQFAAQTPPDILIDTNEAVSPPATQTSKIFLPYTPVEEAQSYKGTKAQSGGSGETPPWDLLAEYSVSLDARDFKKAILTDFLYNGQTTYSTRKSYTSGSVTVSGYFVKHARLSESLFFIFDLVGAILQLTTAVQYAIISGQEFRKSVKIAFLKSRASNETLYSANKSQGGVSPLPP
ncbi:MAG: hypothetical protein M1365_04745, partial [Actinobacteria bacterium]|nr:hypothetical protein [Actinomycetota bacterium]